MIYNILYHEGKSNPERAYQLLLQEVDEKEKKAPRALHTEPNRNN